MKLDAWKSVVDGRALMFVPTGVDPWSVVEPANLPWHMRDIRLFRRGLDVNGAPVKPDLLMQQVEQHGFALHVGVICGA